MLSSVIIASMPHESLENAKLRFGDGFGATHKALAVNDASLRRNLQLIQSVLDELGSVELGPTIMMVSISRARASALAVAMAGALLRLVLLVFENALARG